MPSAKKPRNKGANYRFEFTPRRLVLFCLAAFLLMGWMFGFGILVGRGLLAPDVVKLLESPARIVDMIGKASSDEMDQIGQEREEPDYRFPELLVNKKQQPAGIPHPIQKQEGAPTGRQPPADNAEKDLKRAPPKSPPPVTSEEIPAGGYAVQLASLDNGIRAVRMVEALSSKGYPAYFHKAKVGDRLHYRIRCGPFKTREAAERFRSRITDDFKDAWIAEIKN